MVLTSETLKVFNDVPGLIGYTAFLLLLMNVKFISKVMVKLSEISYEYFLVHTMVFQTIFYFIKPNELTTQCCTGVISIVSAIGISYFYHFIYEGIKKLCK